ncbi:MULTISPECIES: phosphate ABC transporter permease PstA [unclassified Uliginosibacterium]|uniref:phosphate ABC transporter permease PstA n=1 Tax=unclassified Uliginosibacterium TaxID=2621521 RepID=UPI000C7BE26A|nr:MULTISPECIES: phosphate ABC transporter permease PstA [unclassified Uliginosibacterium]MDO6386842.1 phosphate ABC transporter permease PstA [Uliginosibacterium sp. 31-12]PLK48274.1 phosphate ABC transporter, permease protein PstA [Uliginosibacterium sp. TH139]
MQDNDLQAIRSLIARHKRLDWLFAVFGIACLMLGVLTLTSLFVDMWMTGAERLHPDFLTNFPSRRAGQAGILAAWVGSLLVMLVTAAVAIPLGVAAGVYLEEYAPKNWLTDIIEINVSNLAGVPSIVYGLLGLGMFVYTFGLGRSILTAGLTLALLILPVVIVATREAIRAIPQMIREGAYACGATTWQTVRDHIVPYSSPGILTGVIIGMARAIGETAPLIVVGAVTFIAYLPPAPLSGDPAAGLFDWAQAAFTVLPIQMFNWTSRPDVAFHANAAAAGLVLVGMTLAMNAVAIWLRYRLRKNIKW